MSEREVEAEREARRQLRREWGEAYNGVVGILFVEAPIGINFETNTDEYEPEVDTILPRLSSCRSVAEVREVVHQEFLRWFDADTAGPPEAYDRIAQRIWEEVIPLVDGREARPR